MRDLRDIVVRSLIVHVLDAKSTTGLVKSSRAIEVAPNDRVAQYFASHITSSLQDSRALAANFLSRDESDISQTCSTLLAAPGSMVPASHDLADRLYAIMASDKRIASGDLAVCTFTAGSERHTRSYLALLKLDPGFALWHHTEFGDDGLPFVTFEVADNVLPTVNERLQKCAFVRSPKSGEQYQLLVLDDQVGERPGENVARFFLHEFLHSQPVFDAAIGTDALITAFRIGQRQIRNSLSEDQRQDLQLMTRAALRGERIDLNEWIPTLPIPEDAKKSFSETLHREIPDRVIEIDPKVVNAELPKRRFRGTGGLRVDIPADLYQSILQRARQMQDDQGKNYFEVVLHTETWEEVPR